MKNFELTTFQKSKAVKIVTICKLITGTLGFLCFIFGVVMFFSLFFTKIVPSMMGAEQHNTTKTVYATPYNYSNNNVETPTRYKNGKSYSQTKGVTNSKGETNFVTYSTEDDGNTNSITYGTTDKNGNTYSETQSVSRPVTKPNKTSSADESIGDKNIDNIWCSRK